MSKLSELYQEAKKRCHDNGKICPFKWPQKGLSKKILKEFLDKPTYITGAVENTTPEAPNFISITLDLEEHIGANISLSENTISSIKNLVYNFIETVQLPGGDLLIQVGIGTKIEEEKSAISTPFKNESLNSLTFELFEKIDETIEAYDLLYMPEHQMLAEEFFIKYKDVTAIRKCRISESIANDKWIIIDSNTEDNCLFVATEICKKWSNNIKYITDNEYRINQGKFLKFRSEFKYVHKDILYLYAEEQQINIIAYNNIYEKVDYPGNNTLEKYPKVEMQFVDNWQHVKPMLRRKEVEDKYSDVKSLDKVIEEHNIMQSKRRYIRKSNTYTTRDINFGTWDVETFTDNNNQAVVYGIGLYLPKDFDTNMSKDSCLLQFYGKDCVKEFLEYLGSDLLNTKPHEEITLYAHNGGKFDLKCIFNDIIESKCLHVNSNPIYQNGSITMLEVRSKTTKFVFKDSFRLFSSSLKKICKGFNVTTQKGEFDHNKVTNYITSEELLQESKAYNASDCIGLYECLDKFSKLIFDKYKINITKSLSASSLSKNIFTSNYYDNTKKSICLLTKEEDKQIRKGYYGGRTECYKIGLFENTKLHYYDFTSLYPSVGASSMLPIGSPLSCEGDIMSIQEILADTKNVYFVDCKVKSPACCIAKAKIFNNTKKCCLPVLGCHYKRKYVFPIFENYTLLHAVFVTELRLAHIQGYEIEIIKYIKFKRGAPLQKFYKELFNYKNNSTDEAMKYMWKIILNSGYGFFGLRLTDKRSLKMSDCNLLEYKKYLLDNKLINHKQVSGYSLLLVEEDITSNVVNVAIASAITSLARCHLYEAMQKINDSDGTVYYCDTDSIITNICLEENNCIKNIGTKLGYLKNELGYPNYIKNIMITGPKSYWFSVDSASNTACREYVKLKGCSGSNDDKKEIIANMILQYYMSSKIDSASLSSMCGLKTSACHEQLSINSSLSMLLRDNERCNPIVRNIIKHYSLNYTKGNIVGQNIIPLLLLQ